jgi:hypothetical protein
MRAVVVDALAAVHAAGGEVKLVGPERLKVIAPNALPNNLVAQLRAAKPELLALLSSTAKAVTESELVDKQAASKAELIAPAQWFERVAPRTDGELGFAMPCAARRGRVEQRGGVVLHFCAECGAWGLFGYSVNQRGDQLGRWYCARHRP